MRSSTLLALAASLCSSSATVLQGFNYGSTRSDGSFQTEADFQALFSTAKAVSSGFTSARLYTMIQGGSSTNEPTQAIAAAIAEDTTLLLGIWCSAGEADVQAELDALQSAITKYGSDFTKLVVGISVGSEDLYRDSPTGIAADSGAGATPDELVSYISLVRSAIANTGLSGVPVGHVDTWTSWVNSSNSAVAAACDWVGVDAYPYFQNTMANSIEDGPGLFNAAMSATQAAVGHKPVWITETGWPVSGSTQNLAVPSIANAKSYWDNVGCANFGVVNTYWFTLQDAAPVTPNPSFGIVGSTLSDTPLFDVSCAGVTPVSSSAATSTAASGGSTATGSSGLSPSQGVGSGNTSGTGTTSPTSNPTSSPTSPTSASNSSPASNTPSTSTSSPTSTTSYPLSPTSSPVSGPASSSVSASGGPRSSANASAIGSGTGSATSGTGSAASSTVSTSGSVATGLLSGSIVGAVVAAMVVGL